MQKYLQSTPTIDYEDPAVKVFAENAAGGDVDNRERAVRLYYAVRDGIRYDPYNVTFSVEGLRASETLRRGRGWCVPKAVLLAACCRLFSIPARLGYADVRNHLSTVRMRELMTTDVFYWHGYTSILLDGEWLKATPAFNLELCEKLRLLPLEFDGRKDSIYHPLDRDGNRHMDYLNYRGEFDDVPIDEIRGTFLEKYPGFRLLKNGDFNVDVDSEPHGDKTS
jgi:transglutaminase-like putative cysteine protease